ncbi:hypothetical protein ADICYQ_2013 [Cyclobacterium qasimii M12-11B]|uniref:Uncharacterized protein n=1 Tax=Cyclobacterium qasimii M12-11B TaxID=641524 RepID=S7VFY4_9BACT|nr:hypothetical protein ADICYQ_2013 [Cyclobacterium qasimii M12-11B]
MGELGYKQGKLLAISHHQKLAYCEAVLNFADFKSIFIM